MGLPIKPKCAIFSDWIVIFLLGCAYIIIAEYMEPHRQCIPGGDSDGVPIENQCLGEMSDPTPLLGFPYNKSKVLVWWPYVIGCSLWIFIVGLCLIIQRCTMRDSFTVFDRWVILVKMEGIFREFCTSLIITQLIVLVIKKYVGRPRPFFYEYYSVNNKDALQSFPSGHASSTFCIHILLALHVLYAMYWAVNNADKKIYDGTIEVENTHCFFGAIVWRKLRFHNGIKALFVLSLLAIPIWISCSRIIDYYHNYSDVMCGGLIGTGISVLTFIIYNKELYHDHHQESGARAQLQGTESNQSMNHI
mmetsp:Transcript_63658/g.57312  ORF Transcript_63658/g.57312 Transcript_63658/m.57312 type:complete len:305 (-) Transcript_63658:157-1071(-)